MFERGFRPWRYFISHSVLKLRSFGPDCAAYFIEVTFDGVLGMRLKTSYSSLTIATAEPARAEEMLRFCGLAEHRPASWLHCLVLGADGEDGFVVCARYSAWSHPRRLQDEQWPDEQPESVLIHRG